MAKYDIYPDTMAVGSLQKPEDGLAFVVQTTTKASVPCPKMTEVQRDALSDIGPGFCIFNTTAAGTQFYNGSTWLNAGSGAVLAEWATGTLYGIGNFVYTTPDYKLWVATTSHTAGATFAGDLANWDELSSGMAGIGSSTDNAITRWDGTAGNTLQDSSVLIDDTDNVSGVADLDITGTFASSSLNDGFLLRSTTGDIAESGVTIDGSDNLVTTGEITVGSGTSLEFDVGESLYRARSTGMAEPTTLAANGGDNTKFDIGTVTGQIVDTTGVTYTTINYAGATAVTPSITSGANYILINSAGALVQQSTVPTPSERRQNIFVGRVITNATVVSATVVEPVITENLANSVWDLMISLGFFNDNGNSISANGSNLEIDKTTGTIFAPGANYNTDRDDPNRVTIAACTTCTYFPILRSGVGLASKTVLDVANYDVGGVVTAIGGSSNEATNHRVYLFPSGSIVIAYGQETFNNPTQAQARIARESYVKNPILNGGVLVAIISAAKNATDLSDDSQAKFSYPSQFGETVSGSGGVAAATLQGAYDNSTQPQIVLNSTLDGFQVLDASTPIASPLFEVLSNDTLTDYFAVSADSVSTSNDILMTGTGQLDLPVGTTAQRSGTPNSGMLRFNSDTTSFEGYDGSAWGSIGGAGSGGVNYITNSDLEANDDGYDTFDDASAYVDGTGGTASNLTLTRNNTSPIKGSGDLKLVQDAVASPAALYEGFSYDFTIDKGMQAQKLTGSFWYDASDADYVDDDIRIFVYDVTNSQIIRVNGEDIKGGKGVHYFQFQTAPDSTSYRVSFMVNQENTNGFDIYFDQIAVGPTKLARGTIVTNWEDFTPTGSWVSNTTYSGRYRRVGSDMEIQYKIELSGAPTATALDINLPSGLAIDSSKIYLTSSTFTGSGYVRDDGVASYAAGTAYIGNASSLRVVYYRDTSGETTTTSVTQTAPVTLGSSDSITLEATVPISGWTADSVMSEDLGGRDIQARFYRSSNQSITTATETKIQLDSVNYDTTASFDNTTNYDYTIPESGYYDVLAQVNIGNTSSSTVSANQRAFVTYKTNGGSEHTLGGKRLSGGFTGVWNFDLSGSDKRYFDKDDVLTFFVEHNLGSNVKVGSSSDDNTFVAINKSATPQTMLETETVAARYTTNAGLSIGAGGADIIYEDLISDTHNAYNTANGDYVFPVTGCYMYNYSAANDGSDAYSTSQNMNIDVKLNGTDIDRDILFGSGGSGIIQLKVSGLICGSRGDILDIDVQSSVTSNLNTTSKYNTFSIARIK
jgi:hypothetical protein